MAANAAEIKAWLSKEAEEVCQRKKKVNCQEQIWSSLQPELLKLASSFGIGKFDLSLSNSPRMGMNSPSSRLDPGGIVGIFIKLNSPSISFAGGVNIYFDFSLIQPL